MRRKKLLILTFLTFVLLNVFVTFVNAQIQVDDFSGNDPNSYQCLEKDGTVAVGVTPYKDTQTGYFVCDLSTGTERAVLKPPTLQQIEFWFVRIIYAIWALVGTFSFVFLVYLGYQFMLKRDTSDTQLVDLRRRILNYIIGFALVFLAIPILTTFFRLLGINERVDCYNVNMPGFQFFFADLCTDPRLVIVSNPCSFAENATGYACNSLTDSVPAVCSTVIPGVVTIRTCYLCIPTGPQANTWQRRVDFGPGGACGP